MKTSAFSRVSASAPIVRPNTSQRCVIVRRDDVGRSITPAINHSAAQTKNTSSTDFWISASKKIAGA